MFQTARRVWVVAAKTPLIGDRIEIGGKRGAAAGSGKRARERRENVKVWP